MTTLYSGYVESDANIKARMDRHTLRRLEIMAAQGNVAELIEIDLTDPAHTRSGSDDPRTPEQIEAERVANEFDFEKIEPVLF